MLKAFKRLWNSERGNALIIAAAALPMIMGAVGLASDTIQWTLWKRELQRAADSAAIAGVYAVVQSNSVNDAVTRDLNQNNEVGNITVDTDIQHSPTTGAYTADANAVRVELAAQRSLGFSQMFLSAPPTIRATATATIVPTGDYCVVSLESTGTTGITVGGTADVNLGCGMITNSTSMDAAIAFGASQVDASPIAAVGGIDASDNWGSDTQLLPFTLAQDDPFADVDANAPSTCVPGGSLTVNPSATAAPAAGSCYTSITVKGTLTLPDGPLYVSGGDFKVNSGATVTSTTGGSSGGSTIVLTNVSTSSTATIGNMDLNGGATLNLTAPSSGNFEGIAVYQDRRAANCSNCNKINGNSSTFFQGAFYFPKQEAQFNGTAGMSSACMQLVARRVTFTGTSGITNTCPAGSGSGSFEGRSVRLVE